MDVAKRVKSLIGRQNQTQKKFAESIGISPARLNNYLTGIAKVPQDILVREQRRISYRGILGTCIQV